MSLYLDARNALIQNFPETLAINQNENLNGQFTLVSAGLYNYLPWIPVQQHAEVFTGVLLHKKLSLLEQSSPEALDYLFIEGYSSEVKKLIHNYPVIICTFHLGSYRLINQLLVNNKIPFTLVIGKDVLKQEGQAISVLYNEFHEKDKCFKIIDAETSSSVFSMMRELKKGRSVLIYIDGNTGAGTSTQNNTNRCVINFLEQQLFARKGVAFLAHAAGVPILPVISYRKAWDDIRLQFFSPIYPDSKADRNRFAETATQQLYDQVSPYIREYPEQWEGWLYLHKVAHITRGDQRPCRSSFPLASSGSVIFNSAQFGIFKVERATFLFRKSNYLSFPIDRQLYEFLSYAARPINAKQIDFALLQQLCNKNVLIKT